MRWVGAVAAVGILLVGIVLAVVWLRPSPEAEPLDGLTTPTWAVGDRHVYQVNATREWRKDYPVDYPSGPHRLEQTVVAVTPSAYGVLREATWTDGTGAVRRNVTAGILDRDTLSLQTTHHPWLDFPLRPDSRWFTPHADPSLFASQGTRAHVESTSMVQAMGTWYQGWTILHDQPGDGLARSDVITYVPELGVVTRWQTSTAIARDNGTDLWTRDMVLTAIDKVTPPSVPTDARPATDDIVILNRSLDWNDFRAQAALTTYDPDAHEYHFTTRLPWDKWEMIDHFGWTLSERARGMVVPDGVGAAAQVWLDEPGAYTWRVTAYDAEGHPLRHAPVWVSVDHRGVLSNQCPVGPLESWCEVGRIIVPPDWDGSFMNAIASGGDIRYVAPDGTVLNDDTTWAPSRDVLASIDAITVEWRPTQGFLDEATVSVHYTFWYHPPSW